MDEFNPRALTNMTEQTKAFVLGTWEIICWKYLGDNLANDPEIYQKNSPMTYIKQARTPTLIQHGEFDRRVPPPNGYELRQGLEDRVPVELVIYNGYGHVITRPKSVRAVMMHNLAWFNHYLWGDPKPDFTKPDLPPKNEKEETKVTHP